MKSLFKIFTILTPEKRRKSLFLLIMMTIGAMLEALGIASIMPLLSIMGDETFLQKNPSILKLVSIFGIDDQKQFSIFFAGVLIFVYIIKNLYLAIQSKIQIKFTMNLEAKYSSELMDTYLNKSYLFHLSHNSAQILRDVASGAQTAFRNILLPTLNLLTEAITVFGIWIFLVFVDPLTAIGAAGILGFLSILLLKLLRKKISKKGELNSKLQIDVNKWISQGVGAIKETKVLRREKYFSYSFRNAYKEYTNANSSFQFLNSIPRFIIEFIVVFGLLLLIIIKLILNQPINQIVTLLGVLALAAFRLMPSVTRIINYANMIKFQMPLFNELYNEFIQIRDRIQKKETISFANTDKRLVFNKNIEIKNLTFSYNDEEQPVIKNISFEIPKGSFVGIVGTSGAGKTTFVDILLGLLKPSNGEVFVDGIDIFKNIRSWQADLSYVPQSIYLIDGTIRENIAIGIDSTNIDDQRIQEVLEMSELSSFINTLPNGIETEVGERGVRLSGGQKQRIGIARALYQMPEVLVLDEATSALDNETEKSIMNTILKLKGKITIISIAHRLSTLDGCDFKIKFESGISKIEK